MCGSCTLLLEAHLMAHNTAPGLLRHERDWPCLSWPDVDQQVCLACVGCVGLCRSCVGLHPSCVIFLCGLVFFLCVLPCAFPACLMPHLLLCFFVCVLLCHDRDGRHNQSCGDSNAPTLSHHHATGGSTHITAQPSDSRCDYLVSIPCLPCLCPQAWTRVWQEAKGLGRPQWKGLLLGNDSHEV